MRLRTFRGICFTVVLASSLLSQSLLATTTVAVGPATCKPSLVHFSTIQTAVNASPFGTIIDVCPGTYPEQVVITQPLTVQGVTDGVGNAAVITVPGGGLVQNGTSVSFGPVTVQLLVANTVGVVIKNLTVDGNGGNCPAGSNRNIGIGVFNDGSANDGTSAVKIENVVVRNDLGCSGDGILADTSYATITGSEIHDINQTAIDAYNATYSITNNSIQRAFNNGIVLVNNASGTVVSGNNISNTFNGMVLETFNPATITRNTVLNSSDVGLFLFFADHQTVIQNVVSDAPWPIYVWFGNFDTVQNNSLSNALADGIVDVASFGGNIITKNTVNEAPFGIFADSGSASVDTLVPNTFYNTATTIDPGPVSGPPNPGSTP
jgi:parallel beta-helix repeat protein